MRLTLDLLGWTFDIGLESSQPDDPPDLRHDLGSEALTVEPPPDRHRHEEDRRPLGLA